VQAQSEVNTAPMRDVGFLERECVMTNQRGRDAGTGKFKPVEQARRDKQGSIVETVKPRTPAPPPKKK
jgi:hypothetical protein